MKIMKKVTIYTNGPSLFTLENYGKTAGVSHVNGITIHEIVSVEIARAMHEKGSLHYISGIGNSKDLSNIKLNRRLKLNNYEIH